MSNLELAFEVAAWNLQARPDPLLADIVRNASIVHNTYAKDQMAVVWQNGEDILPSWPGVGYLSKGAMDLPAEDLASKLVSILDMLDKRGTIKRLELATK